MSNKFSQYGYFSVTSDMDKVSGNITECFDLNNTRDCAAVILCAHDGTEVSNLILHNLKVALRSSIFTDLTENVEIKDYLHDIFLCFDKKYLKDADQYLRKRGILNERLSKVELDAEIEDLYKSLEELERISKCGCTLSLAILLNDKLYVAHIGDNQIIISMNDEMAEENKFVLLTEEHNFYNKDEFQRIKNECELNANGLRNLYGKSYARYHSRCLGHYEMKYEYMNMEIFRHAKSQPIICVPQLTDGIKLNSKWCYMLFVSSGLYYLVMELIYDRDKIAGEIANEFVMIRKQKPNLNLSEICKLVIYKYLNIYKAAFEENSSFNMDFNKMDHEELTIMAIKLPQTDSALLSDSDEVDPNEKDEDLNEQFPDVQTVSFPFPYLSFDQWNRAESKMTDRELEKFDSIFSLMKIDEDLIIEEESNSVMKLSRATTVNDSNLSNDVLSDEVPDSLDSKMSNIEL